MSTDDKLTSLQETEQELIQPSATLTVDPIISTSTPEQPLDAPQSSALIDRTTPSATNTLTGQGGEGATVTAENSNGTEEARPSSSADQLPISSDGHPDISVGTTVSKQHIEDAPVANQHPGTQTPILAAEDAPTESSPVDPPVEGQGTGVSSSSITASPVSFNASPPTSSSALVATPPAAISPPATAVVATSATVPTAPIRSSSPAIPTKKFASSLSVNKKFLEKAGEKGKPEVKVAVGE